MKAEDFGVSMACNGTGTSVFESAERSKKTASGQFGRSIATRSPRTSSERSREGMAPAWT